MGVGVLDGLHALGGSVAEEIDGVLIQVGPVGVGVNHISTRGAHLAQRTVINGCIYLHATRVNHGTQQCVVFNLDSAQQDGHRQQLECGDGNQGYIMAVADAFGHRYSDAKARVRPWSAAHRHVVEGDGMAVDERQSLIDKGAQALCMIRPAGIFFVPDTTAVNTYRHAAYLSARI